MMIRWQIRRKASSFPPNKRQFRPRPFAGQELTHEAPFTESLARTARFGHSFADVDILPRPVVQPKMRLGPAGGADVGLGLESAIKQARSGGQPLSDRVRQPMERAFGADFGSVRIHEDTQSDQLNRLLQARAFTTGQDIFLRQGEYNPSSRAGQELVAHELTHVVQQNSGTVKRHQQQDKLQIARLQRQDLKEEGDGMEEELTLEEEQEWLQAKPQIQRQTIQKVKFLLQPRSQVQRYTDITIQRAWIGRRQLRGLGFLGKPWVWRKKGNIFNLGLYHEHIFFEDGGSPPDIGHMGKQGLGQDTGRIGDYSRAIENLDDARMRRAVDQVGDPGPYSLLSNNCQKYVADVLRIYWRSGSTSSGARGLKRLEQEMFKRMFPMFF